MAPLSGWKKGGQRRPKLSNASGYQIRKARSRPLKSSLGLSDVYDYEQEKIKRANVSLTLDKDEVDLAGTSGDEDDEDEDAMRRRPRLLGENGDEAIATDDDEEIDSDEAFEESDEERFAGFQFKRMTFNARSSKSKGVQKGVHFAEVNLNEDESNTEKAGDGDSSERESEEEEEESGEDDEFINVLDVLDGRGKDERPVKKLDSASAPERTASKEVASGDEMSEEEGSGDEEEDEEEPVYEDEDDADEDAIGRLNEFVSGLSTTAGMKRKADEGEVYGEDGDATASKYKKKKKLLKDRTEGVAESEFGARTAGPTKLSLSDLVTPLSSTAPSLQKSLKALSSNSAKSQPLPAPLPQRSQEKLDREAAYEQTKKEVEKWSETMKRIKEAEHLSFPLQVERPEQPSTLELTAKFKPTSVLESSIDSLLKKAKLREQDLPSTEALLTKHLSVEEVAARRAELRKMRELAFRADLKAKRVAKIKSKAYRRQKKKERERERRKLDGEAGDGEEREMVEEERMRMEVERARERATLKHKNTGKWARMMKAKGELDEDQRRDMNEMLERGEKLRRRIQGQASGSEDEDGGSDSGDDAFNELARIRAEGEADDEQPNLASKSVFNMKFMKDAEARKLREVIGTIDDFTREMGAMGADVDEDNEGEEGANGASVAVQRVGGRIVFNPVNAVPSSSMNMPPPPSSAISETSTLKSSDHLSPIVEKPPIYPSSQSQPESISLLLPVDSDTAAGPSNPTDGGVNPWLQISESSSAKQTRKRNEVVVGKDSSLAQKSETALKKRIGRTGGEKEKAREDAEVEINTAELLKVTTDAGASKPVSGVKKAKKDLKGKGKETAPARGPKGVQESGNSKNGVEIPHGDSDESDSDSEIEEQEAAISQAKGKGKGPKAFEQRDLVARAFAGDNVVRAFEELKRQEINADAPKEVDTTLPGWGSWGGAGTKRAPPKPHLIKKIAGVDPKSRADYGKAHVIISEKKDKKAQKYLVKDLPYPYTSRAQYERSLETPLGTEWNTRVGFQRGTLPRVVKKMGTVIDPLEQMS